jgi:hypothetical protein
MLLIPETRHELVRIGSRLAPSSSKIHNRTSRYEMLKRPHELLLLSSPHDLFRQTRAVPSSMSPDGPSKHSGRTWSQNCMRLAGQRTQRDVPLCEAAPVETPLLPVAAKAVVTLLCKRRCCGGRRRVRDERWRDRRDS